MAIARFTLGFCLALMCLWTFFWPFLPAAIADSSLLRPGCLATLIVFFGATLVLLAARCHEEE